MILGTLFKSSMMFAACGFLNKGLSERGEAGIGNNTLFIFCLRRVVFVAGYSYRRLLLKIVYYFARRVARVFVYK